uniref:RING-type domain-containing protein n=1 Tax=Echeneis naucrates TaxID=173247 RepID=A0A665UP00_ECHNA
MQTKHSHVETIVNNNISQCQEYKLAHSFHSKGLPMEKPCAERCLICLSLFEQQTVASPENCLHVFCLQCILLWSQTANTCPVDRISFTFIHQRRRPGGCIQKKIKVRTPKQDGDDEGEASNAVICEECGRSDRRHRLLVCIQCDSGYGIKKFTFLCCFLCLGCKSRTKTCTLFPFLLYGNT